MRRERPIRRLNVRFAIILVVAAVVVIGGIAVVHALQIGHTADMMRQRADEHLQAAKTAEAAEQSDQAKQDYEEALRYYNYAVSLDPEDDDSLVQLALLTAERTEKVEGGFREKMQAYALLERAWRRVPDNTEVLRYLAEYAMKIARETDRLGGTGRYQDAVEPLKRLKAAFPSEPKWVVMLAECQMHTGQVQEAEATLQQVIQDYPDNVEAYVQLAGLYLRYRENPDAAENQMNKLVGTNPKSAKAYLARAAFWSNRRASEKDRAAEYLAKAKEDVEKAQRLEPNDLDVLLTSSLMAILEGDFQRARDQLNAAQRRYPDEVRIDNAWMQLALREKKPGLARKHLHSAMEKREVQPSDRFQDAYLRIQEGDLEGIEDELDRLRNSKDLAREGINFLEALVLIRQQKWNEALHLLERTNRKGLRPEFRHQLDMMQAECYGAVGMPDRRLAMYQSLVDANAGDPRALWGLAKSLSAVGRSEEALRRMRAVETIVGTDKLVEDPALRSDLLRMIVARNLQLPEDQRDWKPAEDLLDAITAREDVDDLQKVALRVDLLTRTGREEEARKLIVEAQKDHPKEVSLWVDLADVVSREKGPSAAMQTLAEASQKVAPEDRIRLLGPRIALALRLPPGEAAAALDRLSAEVDQLAEAARPRFWKVLGAAYYQLGRRDRAREFWQKVAEKDNGNWNNHMTLFELAQETGDEAEMEARAARIAELLGDDSAESLYCRAARLVWRVRNGSAARQSLAEAEQWVREAQGKRSSWHVLLRLLADIHLLQDDRQEAISNLKRASELGPLTDSYLRKLAELLQADGRPEEAKRYLDQLSRREDSFSVKRLEAEVGLRSGNEDDALKAAAETIKDSKDPRQWLWYGSFLARAEKHDEAEDAYRRAVELDPQDVVAWQMLVRHLVRRDKMDDARKAVARARIELAEDRKSLVLGRCYELLGQRRRAEQSYQAAVAADPNNLAKLQALCLFYLKTDAAKAEPHLVQILRVAQGEASGVSPRDVAKLQRWARRGLARVWARSGSYERQVRALKLLEQNAIDGRLDIDDRLIQADIFASRKERSFADRAIEILENLNTESGLAPPYRLKLAQLYDRTDRWNASLVNDLRLDYGNDPAVLVGCLRLLLKHFTPGASDVTASDIETGLQQLEQVEADKPSITELRARFLIAQGKADEGIALLRSLIPQETKMSQTGFRRLNYVASVLQEVGEIDAAEALLTEAAEKRPELNMLLAGVLARHRNLDEALDKCEAAGAALPASQIFPGAVRILDMKPDQITDEHLDRVEAILAKIPQRYHNSPNILKSKARLRELQGRYDEAVAAYREYLQREDVSDAGRAAVGNNLAYILAMQGRQTDEALEMVNRAIASFGPTPGLLDTRAVVYLAMNEPERAVSDLDRAIKDDPAATRYFHRALAHDKLNERDQARQWLLTEPQGQNRPTPERLPRIERKMYQELKARLEGAG